MRGLSLIIIGAVFGATGFGAFALGARSQPDATQVYIARRSINLIDEAHRVPRGLSLVLGDSISERSFIPSVCGVPAFNAGVSGATAADLVKIAEPIIGEAKPATVLIAVGVNDAKLGGSTSDEQWEASYRQLLNATKGIPTILVGIMPVEDGKPVGSNYFSRDAIARKNVIVARLAKQYGLSLVRPLAHLDTLDGVHPSRDGAQAWRAAVALGCGSASLQPLTATPV